MTVEKGDTRVGGRGHRRGGRGGRRGILLIVTIVVPVINGVPTYIEATTCFSKRI